MNSRNDIEDGEQKEEEILQVPPPHVVQYPVLLDLWRSGLLDQRDAGKCVFLLFEPPNTNVTQKIVTDGRTPQQAAAGHTYWVLGITVSHVECGSWTLIFSLN